MTVQYVRSPGPHASSSTPLVYLNGVCLGRVSNLTVDIYTYLGNTSSHVGYWPYDMNTSTTTSYSLRLPVERHHVVKMQWRNDQGELREALLREEPYWVEHTSLPSFLVAVSTSAPREGVPVPPPHVVRRDWLRLQGRTEEELPPPRAGLARRGLLARLRAQARMEVWA